MLWILTSAFALDCSDPGLDAQICADANDMAALIAIEYGSAVVNDDAKKARLRTSHVYDTLVAMHAEIPDCTFDGIIAGDQVSRTSFDSLYDGAVGTGSASGLVDQGTIAGSFVGGFIGSLGDLFGKIDTGEFAANRGAAGFVAGNFSHVKGKRGVHWGYSGSCTTPDREALDPWFNGRLIDERRIFQTRPWSNPLTGIATMDAECQAEWDDLGDGPAVFKAAVTHHSAGIFNPAARFPADSDAVVLAGSLDYVSASVAEFFDYGVDVAVDIDVIADGTTFAWDANTAGSITPWGDFLVGADPAGEGRGDCDGWTNPSPSIAATGGEPNTNEVRVYGWALGCDTIANPGVQFRTFCIEE